MISLPKPQKFESRLASITKVSPRVYLEQFELVNPTEITFLSGQTVMLMLAPGVNRVMSIASPPSENHAILLCHDVGPMGPYSKWALSAKVGDPMQMTGPLGAFVLDRQSGRKKVFVATGTGIAPFYGMTKDYLLSGGTDDVTIYWGMRHEEDIFWQNDFEELARRYPNFRFILTVSQASEGWQGKRGHVGDHLFADEKNLPAADIYLCGNKNMVADMRTRLPQAGVPSAQIKFELFY